jgi:hypothetical protein
MKYLFRENSEKADLVSSKEAKAKCPHLVFQFYEERIVWVIHYRLVKAGGVI